MNVDRTGQFKFGLEAEFLLVRSTDYSPLWIHDLNADQLLDIIDSIDTSDLSIDGLNVKPLHRGPTHYLVEGYTLTDEAMQPAKLLPKGLEIRTPTASSIEMSISHLQLLHARMNEALKKHGMRSAIVSHHPGSFDSGCPAQLH